jgi:hypothetical protein
MCMGRWKHLQWIIGLDATEYLEVKLGESCWHNAWPGANHDISATVNYATRKDMIHIIGIS